MSNQKPLCLIERRSTRSYSILRTNVSDVWRGDRQASIRSFQKNSYGGGANSYPTARVARSASKSSSRLYLMISIAWMRDSKSSP